MKQGLSAWGVWRVVCLLACALTAGPVLAAGSEPPVVRIYLDADRQHHIQSAASIELGVRAALHSVDNRVAGYQIEVVPLDHRGNVKRSKLNMLAYLEDDAALAFVGGMHSPPYLRYKDFINSKRVLALLPWSAAGPLTRVEGGENWVFRLSIDDTKAAERLVDFALNQQGCRRPALLLWESGWGRTNHKTLTASLARAGHDAVPVFYFQGSLARTDAYLLATKVYDSGTDCAVLVANAPEGVQVVSELARLPEPPRVISHWGITGGDFKYTVAAPTRDRVDLYFLQTCYTLGGPDASPMLDEAWQHAQSVGAEVLSLSQLDAPAGFFHAYDLTLLLVAALENSGAQPDIETLRWRVRDALESLSEPIAGLMRTYSSPFGAFAASVPDAHEALGLDDMCMARWDAEGRMITRHAAER
ncbi:MAG: ABC transporter substrate-binding protein [Pseudomonadota bacterium]